MSEYRSKRRVIIDYRVFFWSNEPTEKNIVQNDTYSSVDYRYTIPNIIRDVCAGTYWTAADCIYNLMFIYTDRHRQVNRDTIVIITITGLMQVVLTMRVMAIFFSVYLFDSTTIFSTETKILFLIFVLMI